MCAGASSARLCVGPSQLRKAGYSAQVLKKVGFPLYELAEGKYTATELKRARYEADELKEVGFKAGDLNEAGFRSKQLRAAGYKLREMQEGGYMWQDLGMQLQPCVLPRRRSTRPVRVAPCYPYPMLACGVPLTHAEWQCWRPCCPNGPLPHTPTCRPLAGFHAS